MSQKPQMIERTTNPTTEINSLASSTPKERNQRRNHQPTPILNEKSQSQHFDRFVIRKAFQDDPCYLHQKAISPSNSPRASLTELRKDLAQICSDELKLVSFREDPISAKQNPDVLEKIERDKELNSKVIREMHHILKNSSSDEEPRIKIMYQDISILLTKPATALKLLECFQHKKSLLKNDNLEDLLVELRGASKNFMDGSGLVQKVRFIVETGISTFTQVEEKCLRLLEFMYDFEEKRSSKGKQKILNIYLWVTVSNLLEFNSIENLTDKIEKLGAELKTPKLKFKDKKKLESQRKLLKLVRKYFERFEQHLLFINIPKFSITSRDNQLEQNQFMKTRSAGGIELKKRKKEILARIRDKVEKLQQGKKVKEEASRRNLQIESSEVHKSDGLSLEKIKNEEQSLGDRDGEKIKKEKHKIRTEVKN